MARQIKGISVRIGADTTGLNKALKDVKSQSRKIGRELYQVNRALKFNPDSVELWSQKQELLTKRVEETKKKLDVLRQAQDKVEKKFKSGEIDDAQYRRFNRELIKAEDQLESFTSELEKTQRQATEFSRKMQKAADNMEKFGNKMKGIGDNLSTHVTLPLTAAFFALTEGTRDFRKEISVLENNADTAGVSMEELDEKMAQLNAVTGELDSNVEGVSSLLAAGFEGEMLTDVVNELSGAVTKFPDTLKFENLSESIQETIGSGQSVGQFDEMLSRLGISLDDFNDGLQRAKENGQATDYVMQTLASTGLSDVYEQYRDNNEALVESAEAYYNLQSSLAELGKELEPIMTEIVEGVTDVVDAFNDLSEEEQDMVIFGAGVVAALGPLLSLTGNLSLTISSLAGAISGAGGLNAALSTLAGNLGPFAVGGGIILGLSQIVTHFKEMAQLSNDIKSDFIQVTNLHEAQLELERIRKEMELIKDRGGDLGQGLGINRAKIDNNPSSNSNYAALLEKEQQLLEQIEKLKNEDGETIKINTEVDSASSGGSEGKTSAEILQEQMSLFQAQMTLGEKNIDQYRNFLEEQFNSTEKFSKETRAMLKEELEKVNDLYNKPEEFISNLFEEEKSAANLASGLSQKYGFDENIAVEAAKAIQESLRAENEAIAKLKEEQSQYQEGTDIYEEYNEAIATVAEKWETTTEIVRKYQNKQQEINEEAREKELQAEKELQQEILENRYEMNDLSETEYRRYLRERLAEYDEYTDEWVRIRKKINKTLEADSDPNEFSSNLANLSRMGRNAASGYDEKNSTKDQVKSINWMTDAFVDMGMEIENANQKFTDWKDDLVTGLSEAIVQGESLTDVFKSIADQIAALTIKKAFIEPFVTWGLGEMGLETAHTGGYVSPAGKIIESYKFHSGGGVGLKNDEVPAILQTGEYVMSREQVNNLKNNEGSGNTEIHINAVDAASFVALAQRNPEAITGVFANDYQKNGITRKIIKGGR